MKSYKNIFARLLIGAAIMTTGSQICACPVDPPVIDQASLKLLRDYRNLLQMLHAVSPEERDVASNITSDAAAVYSQANHLSILLETRNKMIDRRDARTVISIIGRDAKLAYKEVEIYVKSTNIGLPFLKSPSLVTQAILVRDDMSAISDILHDCTRSPQ